MAFRIGEGSRRRFHRTLSRFFCIASKWRREANEQFAIATTGFRSHDQSKEHMTFHVSIPAFSDVVHLLFGGQVELLSDPCVL